MADRIKTQYKIARTKVITVLGLSDVQDIAWDGNNLIFRHSDVETPNDPLQSITKIQEVYTIKSWDVIKTQFFDSIPDEKFERMTITIDDTDIYIELNLEEAA